MTVYTDLSEEFEGLELGWTKDVCSHLLFCSCVIVVSEFAREGVSSEWLYADALLLISD